MCLFYGCVSGRSGKRDVNMKIVVWASIIFISLTVGCGKKSDTARLPDPVDANIIIEMSRINAGKNKLVREFNEIYPNSIGFFSHLSGTHGDTEWNSIAYLYGRYEIVMKMPVNLSRDKKSIESWGEPSFYLIEYIAHQTSGTNKIFMMSRGWVFDYRLWKTLVEKNGEIENVFNSIPPYEKNSMMGVKNIPEKILKDQPLPGFYEYFFRK